MKTQTGRLMSRDRPIQGKKSEALGLFKAGKISWEEAELIVWGREAIEQRDIDEALQEAHG